MSEKKNSEPTLEFLEKYNMNNPLGMFIMIIPMTVISIVECLKGFRNE